MLLAVTNGRQRLANDTSVDLISADFAMCICKLVFLEIPEC